jgi:phosphoglycolate phosphatase
MKRMSFKAAVFDMDGTILDTLADLNASLNHALGACGHRCDFEGETTKAFFGSGIRVAIRRALALEQGFPEEKLDVIGTEEEPELPVTEEEIERIRQVYSPHYQAHCNDVTGPYPGIPELLERLRNAGVKTAVVSNKPDAAVQKLAEESFPGGFDYALGEAAGTARKPAPDMVMKCLARFGLAPGEAVYIGDSEVDLQTAENAGLMCICVDWGFRSRDYLEKRDAGVIVSSCEEIFRIITGGMDDEVR